MNHYTKRAIEMAKSVGYIAEPFFAQETYHGHCERNRIFLDPEFWKCLGKAKGWKDRCLFCGGNQQGCKDADTPNGPGEYWSNCDGCGADWMNRSEFPEGNAVSGALFHQHYLVDHINSGGNPESFFQLILEEK